MEQTDERQSLARNIRSGCLIAWTTSAALVVFGIVYFDDAAIMGRTILALGLLSAGYEAVKFRAARSGGDYRRLRLALALAYLGLAAHGKQQSSSTAPAAFRNDIRDRIIRTESTWPSRRSVALRNATGVCSR